MLESESMVYTTMIAVEQYDLSSLQTIMSGAAPLGASLVQQVGLCRCSQSRFVDKEDVRCLPGLRVSARILKSL